MFALVEVSSKTGAARSAVRAIACAAACLWPLASHAGDTVRPVVAPEPSPARRARVAPKPEWAAKPVPDGVLKVAGEVRFIRHGQFLVHEVTPPAGPAYWGEVLSALGESLRNVLAVPPGLSLPVKATATFRLSATGTVSDLLVAPPTTDEHFARLCELALTTTPLPSAPAKLRPAFEKGDAAIAINLSLPQGTGPISVKASRPDRADPIPLAESQLGQEKPYPPGGPEGKWWTDAKTAIGSRWSALVNESKGALEWGRVAFEFRVNPEGHPVDVRLTGGDGSTVLARCSRRAIAESVFSPPPTDLTASAIQTIDFVVYPAGLGPDPRPASMGSTRNLPPSSGNHPGAGLEKGSPDSVTESILPSP